MNINKLLEDISIRHACKNVSKYAADLEKELDIKLVPASDDSLEFTWSKCFKWYTDASDKEDCILYYFKRQKPKMFSIKDSKISGRYTLHFTFKFHPENAV